MRDVPLKGIPQKNMRTTKVSSTSNVTKVARVLNPIMAMKDKNGYQRVHGILQSTSSYNIVPVNTLNGCRLFA